MTKTDLATFDSFKKSLLTSGDDRARTSILFRPEAELRRTYRQVRLVEDINRLQRPGKGYTCIEWHTTDEGSLSTGCLKASLIWREFNWLAGVEVSTRLQLTEDTRNRYTGVESVKKKWMIVGTRPPPYKPFSPLPKTEIGSCARSDSSLRPQ